MLRTNLATRPFYNERVVHLGLAVLGIVALGFMAWTAREVVALSQLHGELTTEAEEAERIADDVAGRTAAIRQDLNQEELVRLAEAAAEANRLIDQRVFSWTRFLNLIERTLPASVMLTSVRPAAGPKGTEVTMGVLARGVEDIDQFIEELERTGAFTDVLSRQEEITEEKMYRAVLRGQYRGGVDETEPEPDAEIVPAEPIDVPPPSAHPDATPVERETQP